MTFVQVFIQHIESLYTGDATLYFGQGPNDPTVPYVVILIVPPNVETPTTLCLDEGEGGTVTLQFSLAANSFQAAYNDLEELKNIVQMIRGKIGTTPNDYYVTANRTGGVTTFDASLGTWSALFECDVDWEVVT